MKLSRCGICSRSEGTRVEPSRAGSRLKCVLSKMMVTTWLTFPRGELSWQPPTGLGAGGAGLAAASFADAPAGGAHARAAGDKARRTAVPRARAWRQGLDQAFAPEPSLFSCAEFGRNFISLSCCQS